MSLRVDHAHDNVASFDTVVLSNNNIRLGKNQSSQNENRSNVADFHNEFS